MLEKLEMAPAQQNFTERLNHIHAEIERIDQDNYKPTNDDRKLEL